jgi:small subunit ribosomal protein S20
VFVLPQRRTAIKALRINKKRHLHNLDIKTDLKKTVKKFEGLVAKKNSEEAKLLLKIIYKKFDKAAKRHLIHEKTAARRKSRFNLLLKSIA